MIGQIAQSRVNHRIKFKICSTMFLYTKKRWIIMVGTKLQEIELAYNKRQNTTTLNWGSN